MAIQVLTFLTSLLTSSKTFFGKNKYSVIITTLAIIFAFINLIQFKTNSNVKKQLEIAEHNLKAATDEVRITKDKAGKDESNKFAFLVDELKDLKNANKELYNEIKKIKGNVATVIKGDVEIIEKQVPFVVKAELIDSTVRADFKFDTVYSPGNYKKIEGFTKYDLKTGKVYGEKTKDEMGIKFTTGIKNLDIGKPEIFFKSDYPGLTVTDLDGAVIDPNLFKKKKEKKLKIGLHAGYSPFYYNFSKKKAGFANQVTAGVGLNYNF